jgi:hypothetical protein
MIEKNKWYIYSNNYGAFFPIFTTDRDSLFPIEEVDVFWKYRTPICRMERAKVKDLYKVKPKHIGKVEGLNMNIKELIELKRGVYYSA